MQLPYRHTGSKYSCKKDADLVIRAPAVRINEMILATQLLQEDV